MHYIASLSIAGSECIPWSEEVLLCGPSSIVKCFINHKPANTLVDIGASMSVVKETFQRPHFFNVVLLPWDVNATSVTGDPLTFKGVFSASLRISKNVAFHDFYVASGFQQNFVLGTGFFTRLACQLISQVGRSSGTWRQHSWLQIHQIPNGLFH